jgi:hypothetical protein
MEAFQTFKVIGKIDGCIIKLSKVSTFKPFLHFIWHSENKVALTCSLTLSVYKRAVEHHCYVTDPNIWSVAPTGALE